MFLTTSVILGQFSSFRLIGNKGTVRTLGIGVYWDANCSNPVYILDWGKVTPDVVKNMTVFIRNEGDDPTILHLGTDNWNPSNASSFVTLNWDYNDYIVQPQQAIQVVFALFIAGTTQSVRDFAFDVIISIQV